MNFRQWFIENCTHANINLHTGECSCGFRHNYAPLIWKNGKLTPFRVEDEIREKFDDFDRRYSIFKYKTEEFKLNKMKFITRSNNVEIC